MKAPDKVFFPNDINVLTILGLRMEQKDDVCYIRKDVVDDMLKTAEDHAYFAGKEKMREELLEWAKETKEIVDTDCGINEDVRKGASWELDEIIEHINKM